MERTETQRRILEVGKKEFLEKGFKDASLNQIVAEAGFTKGAFYGYYPDKTALFEDLSISEGQVFDISQCNIGLFLALYVNLILIYIGRDRCCGG